MANDFELLTRASLLSAVRDPQDRRRWQAGWEEFKEIYDGPIRSWAIRMGLNSFDAEELTQDVLITLLTELQTFYYDPKKRFRSWLRRVVSTSVNDRWRERRRKPGNWGTGDSAAQEALQELPNPSGSGFDELLEELENRLERGRLLSEASEYVKRKVSEQTWQVFLMLMVDGVEEAVVATKFGIKISAVYATKQRVLKMIRAKVSQIQGGADQES